MENSKNFQFEKFKKILIWKIPRISNLEKCEHYKLEKFQKFPIRQISKMSICQKFPVSNISKISNLGIFKNCSSESSQNF